jgi:hypothetical protein
MKTAFGVLAIMAGLYIPALAQNKAFKGEIMDSQCAAMGSHDQMMKQEGAKNAKECSDACVKMGGKYVLYDAGTKTTYQLDDQTKAKKLSGQKVTVTGTFDKSTQTVLVKNMKPQS